LNFKDYSGQFDVENCGIRKNGDFSSERNAKCF
jgi:hypothetical protein